MSDSASKKDGTVSETTDTSNTTSVKRKRQLPSMETARIRAAVARVVWLVCLVFAVVLAVAVLLIAVKASGTNSLVRFDIRFADHVDLGFFDLKNPVKDFDTKKKAATDIKTALFNYGICAIIWLAIGRVADRIIRP